jgi:two-component system, OmpR family, phosphate regulon sensor histidine kinase PhoR
VKNKDITLLAIFGALVILAILVVQIFWVKDALNISTRQFDNTVTIALREVAEKIAFNNKTTYQYKNPVKRINPAQYIVQVNGEIDAELLDYYISSTFDYFDIKQDVEYNIYDCTSNTLVYCNYIQKNKFQKPYNELPQPKFEGLDYYFTVTFPHYSITSMHNVPMWVVTSLVLTLAILFFIYALYVVIRQRNITQVQKDFINNMTHEFKTPISTISIIQQVISDPEIVKSPQRLGTYSQIIGVEINRLNDQVEKVLNIARIEKGQFTLHKERISVGEVIQQLTRSINATDLSENVIVEEILDDHDDTIFADKVHFTNILFNLVDNAVKYGGKPPQIVIETEIINNKIFVKIKDNGRGIDKKNIKKIFDKFYRVPTGNVHDVKGFGLGLYYVSKIIEAHRWKISVSSQLGTGTTFLLEIPLEN